MKLFIFWKKKKFIIENFPELIKSLIVKKRKNVQQPGNFIELNKNSKQIAREATKFQG